MSVSVAAAEQTLHSGMSSILESIEDLHGGPVGSRVQRARDVWNRLTWCEARSNEVQALYDDTLTDTCLIVVPDHEARYLPTQATMQTQKARDGSVMVFVRAAAFRPRWAALGLLHELSHVIDYHDSVDIDSTPEAELDSEARAYHLEMVAYDRMVDGKLASALSAMRSTPISIEGLRNGSTRYPLLDLERRARLTERPHASDRELSLRDGFYTVALVLASAWSETDPAMVERPEDARPALSELLRIRVI